MTHDDMDDLMKGLDKFLAQNQSDMNETDLNAILESAGVDAEAATNRLLSFIEAQSGDKTPPKAEGRIIDLAKARAKIRLLAANDPRFENLTIAARQGSELSDEDLRFLIEDLIELGLISESELGQD